MSKRRANGEGSIYRRSDGLWTAQYTLSDGRRRYIYARTQLAAAERLRDAMVTQRAEPCERLFGDFITEWLEVYVRPTVRPRTYAAYHSEIFEHILPAVGSIPLGELREETLQRFLSDELAARRDGREGGYSRSTVGHLRARLKSSLEKAVELEYIPKNPARKLLLPPKDSQEKLVFTREEQRRFEQAAAELLEKRWLAALPLLLLRTGLRVGEALGLRLEDIDLWRRELYVRRTVGRISTPGSGHAPICEGAPKTRQSRRTVPLDKSTAALLRDTLERRDALIRSCGEKWRSDKNWSPEWMDKGYIFLTRFGALMDTADARRLLVLIEERADLPPVTLHGLRHTFATRWVESGLDIKSLSELLGHSDTQMTLNTYTHSLPDQRRACVDRLSELLKG